MSGRLPPADLTRALAAELVKLRTLRLTQVTALTTVLTTALLAATISVGSPDPDRPTVPLTVAGVLLTVLPWVQVGPILLGVVAAGADLSGVRGRTALLATPDRVQLLIAKTLATLVVAGVTVGTAVLAALGVAATAGLGSAVPLGGSAVWWRTLGAATYLVLLALLGHLIAVLLRSLPAALSVLVALVTVISPLLAALTPAARWLPDRAGRALFATSIDLLSPAGGAAVAMGWLAVLTLGAGAAFVRRDA